MASTPKLPSKGIMAAILNVVEPPLDPTLVDNTPRLLHLLNTTSNVHKLLNKRDERGYTLVHLAAERNQPESLKCLLIKEGNPNVKSFPETAEVTPVHVAAGAGHLACLQLLVQLGGDVLARDAKQLTPIDYANINGQELCLNYLHSVLSKRHFDEKAELEDVLVEVERNLAANNVTTLAHWKLFNSFFPLAVPSDPDKQLNQTESIMFRQCLLINNEELVKVLSRVAKDIPLTHSHCSLLHAAARYGRLELAKLITEKVPQLAISVTAEGYNALHIAVAHKQTAIVKLLTQKQVQWSHHKPSLNEEHPDIVDGVAKFGSTTMSGHTALHFAVAMRDHDSLRYVLKHHRELQLSINGSECGYTALHLAVFLNNLDAIQTLLRRGANPNTRIDLTLLDKLQISRTPLIEAAIHKNPTALNMLLEGGADDRHHDALKVCVPTVTSHEILLPLLSSLVRADETHRSLKTSHKDRRVKMAAIEWSNLSLPELSSSDFSGALSRAMFLRSQGIDRSKFMDCVTSMNVSNNSLSSLPVELFRLSHLTTLNASNNGITSLPEIYKQSIGSELDPYQWPCAALAKLNVSKNALSDLPEFLFFLPNLSNLDLSHNTLRHLPIALWRSPKLHTFNCSHNSIEEIPTNWPQVLQECTIINTSPPPDQQSPQCMSPTSMMKQNTPSVRTPREDVPRYLTLSGDSRTSTEDDGGSDREATPITKLQDRLNIANANLTIEWEKICASEEAYEGLAILNLSHNLISEIPENLPCLAPKLKRLDLSFNKLTSVSLPRSLPSTLTNLYLSNNFLTEINCHQAMAKPLPCTNPQVLVDNDKTIHLDNISYCLHRSHGQLLSLGVLEAAHCELDLVNFYTPQVVNPQSAPSDRENPHTDPRLVAADNTRPGRRPSNLHSLRRLVTPLLTRLTLHHNLIAEVPESVCEITSLTSLDLSHNKIIQLPANLGNLGNLWEFPLAGLKLISPPHNIIERGKTKDIIGFLWSLLQKARPYHRMKLMLVGKAARGKTTLLMRISERGQRGIQENWGIKRMRDVPVTPNLSTVGIVVSDWTYYRKVKESQTSLKSITFMTWDFGGQEEYYATHQCFLSRRSLYLVVWNVTHFMEGAEELKPWLLNIQARAPHSPVIIVGTHFDKVGSRQRGLLNHCTEYINSHYGTVESRKEGYPQVMGSFLVSCKGGGRGIAELRDHIFDVASQVKENTVSGRGIGCGRIPEYRLLMDQLVPASYLQLEDTVKKIAFNMKQQGKPPVLTYKELREHVFQDPHTLISKSSVDRELEQAVRFLHDNGTMLHYDDPLLCDLYFVDPQWLCDMLAHIITVREINPMIRDGIMKIRDLRHIFNDQEFPIRWQREYIRLLTTFEVAVELGGGELLIPSTLPLIKPNLPHSMFPEELKFLPPLRHVYVVPFIPSGFWPRLISRLLTDASITHLVCAGCGIAEDEVDQLSWDKWRTGLILQYGNLKLLSVSELDEGLFPGMKNLQGIRIFSDDKWRLHKPDVEIFGVNIEVPDVYPILKFPEIKRRKKYVRVQPWARKPPPEIVVASNESTDCEESVESGGVRGDGVQRQIQLDQVDDEFQRLVAQRVRLNTVGTSLKPERSQSVRKTQSMEDLSKEAPSDSSPPQPAEPCISEDSLDMMRVGLLSKVVEHITLLVEDWFVGVRPRTLVVPCPHCTANHPHQYVPINRSFSCAMNLLPDSERREREKEWLAADVSEVAPPSQSSGRPATHSENEDSLASSSHPYRSGLNTDPRPSRHMKSGSQRPLSPEPYAYAFRYNDCVVTARSLDTMFCPAHGDIQLQFMAPDTLFLTQGKNVIVKDVTGMEKIGQGAFATVFKAKYRKTGPEGEVTRDVAIKALTKEWRQQEREGEESETRELLTRAPTRHSIVEGFSNLKKELSILAPLEHPHVIELFGVMLRPLALVLEFAPQGSMKDKLKAYNESQKHIHVAVLQPLIIQLANAIQYLHSRSVIYRDLKSDNILVWRFPDPLEAIPKPPPGRQLGEETVFVKLSDYGISQFVATQGARGLVGTPGFIAPEILKYQGREVYTQQVDIFSFGMLIYELITLHIPYDSLNAQQANQANERGSRPPLTKKDFPCPVLLRELMVWCWQQNPEHRPTAPQIIEATSSEQFPRLLDGIRACNAGQVTSSCVRVATPTYLNGWKGRRIHSPSTISLSSRPSYPQSPQPMSILHRTTPSIDERGIPQSIGEPPMPLTEPGDSESSSPSGPSPLFSPLRKASLEEPRSKYLWSPQIPDQLFSPFSDDEQSSYELWVCSSDAHHSTASVIEYSGRFTNVEDIELGDSPVLSMCAARDKVWMGFEIGYLIIFDTGTKKAFTQAWVKQHKAILSMVYIPALRRVYVGLSDGTVYSYSDEVVGGSVGYGPAKVRMTPLAEYSDSSQSSSCFLVVPQGKKSEGGVTFELWVGQKRGVITILDAETLSVLKFVRTTMDMSKVPSYTAYLSYAHLVCGMSPDYRGDCVVRGCIIVYGALYHGQFVSRWDTVAKREVDCVNCQSFMEDQSQDCCISSLLYSHSQLYVGLTCGVILIFEPFMQSCLGRLTCHRSTVQFLLSLDLSLASSDDVTMMSSLRSDSPYYTSSDGQSLGRRSPTLSSLGGSGLGPASSQLLSVGSGFKSYFDGPESEITGHSGFLLVWDSEHWKEAAGTV